MPAEPLGFWAYPIGIQISPYSQWRVAKNWTCPFDQLISQWPDASQQPISQWPLVSDQSEQRGRSNWPVKNRLLRHARRPAIEKLFTVHMGQKLQDGKKVLEMSQLHPHSKTRPVQTIHPTDLGLLPSWNSIVGPPAQELSPSWTARKRMQERVEIS